MNVAIPVVEVSNSQNFVISLKTVDFYQKTFLILYPSLENSTTSIAIFMNAHLFNK
jgi:hypothetical protein